MGRKLFTFNIAHYVYEKSNLVFSNFSRDGDEKHGKNQLHKNRFEICFGLSVTPKNFSPSMKSTTATKNPTLVFFPFGLEQSVEHGKMSH